MLLFEGRSFRPSDSEVKGAKNSGTDLVLYERSFFFVDPNVFDPGPRLVSKLNSMNSQVKLKFKINGL